MKKFLPILQWLPNYRREWLKGDISAGLTVGVMLIPQGMAYAMLAGMPLVNGLYAATIPLILYAIFGTSRRLSVGPVALDSILLSSGLVGMAVAGSEDYISIAILLACMVGTIQLLMGMARLGFLVNFLSRPVISGFTSAAALIIALSQLGHLLGVSLPRTNQAYMYLVNAAKLANQIHLPTLLLGLIGIGFIYGLKRWKPGFPGALVAVALATAAVWLFGLENIGIGIVGEVPAGFPVPTFPELDRARIWELTPIAGTLALVGFMEVYSIGKALEVRYRDHEVNANQELIAMGAANLGAGIFRGFPISGGFSRSAVNEQSGANTGLATLISAAFVSLTLIFLTELFYTMPKAILASLIMVAVAKLIDWRTARRLWFRDRADFYLLIATFIATLTLGIPNGIGIGVGLSLLVVIYRSAYPHMAVLGRLANTRHYRNFKRFPYAEDRPDILVLRFDAEMYYANINFFRDRLRELVDQKGEDLKLVVVNAESIHHLDSTAVAVLTDLIRDLRKKDIAFSFAAVNGPVRDIIFRSGLMQELQGEGMYIHVSEAVRHFDAEEEAVVLINGERVAYQTNVNLEEE